MNMQSAQVNQMAVQLKNKIKDIQNVSDIHNEQTSQIFKTGRYEELISGMDRDFWNYLCKKDFERLEKLLSQGIGEGYFLDDSDSDDSEEEKKGYSEDEDHFQGLQNPRGRVTDRKRCPKDGRDDHDEFDHDHFMEELMATMHGQEEDEQRKKAELRREIQEEEDKAELEKQLKVAKYNENQFW